MSVGTDAAALTQAVGEAASALAAALAIQAAPGPGFDPWGQAPAQLAELAEGQATAWTAPLLGPLGPCGEVGIVLEAGPACPGEDQIAAALAACCPALGPATGGDRTGQVAGCDPAGLLQARPGQRATATPLVSGTGWAGLLVVIVNPAAAELPHLDPMPGPAGARSITTLSEVEMTISVELGRTKIPIKDLLSVHNGSVVQLDREVTQPVDIFVHGTLIARGEVVVVDECFAVRVTELLTGD